VDSRLSSQKDIFKKHFTQWVVEQSMPLTVGEAPAFIAMIKAANKSLSIPDNKTTYDLVFSKKKGLDTQAEMLLGIKEFLDNM
jgi:hypothetical protein